MYCVNKRETTGCCGLLLKIRNGYLGGRDQALEFLEGREPRLSNFLGLYCNITISLYFDISSYQLGETKLSNTWSGENQDSRISWDYIVILLLVYILISVSISQKQINLKLTNK